MVVAVALAQRKPTTSEIECERSISGLVGLLIGGGGQRKHATPENERERSFSGVVGCWWSKDAHNP